METKRNGTMTLTLCRSADVNYLNLAATLIRELPRVLRVRVDFNARRLEILYQDAPVGLVREIHTALLSADSGMEVLRAH